jgi:hypothetical protein
VPQENTNSRLIYVLGHANREAREQAWKGFLADADWKKAKAESEKGGALVARIESKFLTATDYSPAIKSAVGAAPRVFELREYTTTPGNLPALDSRFRDHTTKLFAKHGMENLFYWHPAAGQPGADNALIYILAHKSREAGAESFKNFRADADWLAARGASEKKAGGSLTVPDGVKSTYMNATDYSATR